MRSGRSRIVLVRPGASLITGKNAIHDVDYV